MANVVKAQGPEFNSQFSKQNKQTTKQTKKQHKQTKIMGVHLYCMLTLIPLTGVYPEVVYLDCMVLLDSVF
jgi:cytochrome b561